MKFKVTLQFAMDGRLQYTARHDYECESATEAARRCYWEWRHEHEARSPSERATILPIFPNLECVDFAFVTCYEQRVAVKVSGNDVMAPL